MKPCTTSTSQCQRVPYTTYRPVYRQETYKVNVTTITNDCCPTDTCSPCATGTCATGTCATGTCGTGGVVSPQPNYAPVPTPAPQTSTYYETPGTITTGGSYGSGGFTPSVPADQTPSLSSPTTSQRPVTDRLNSGVVTGYQTSIGPTKINIQQTAARSPTREQWSYSPVRLASYQKPTTTRSQLVPLTRQPAVLQRAQNRTNLTQPVKRNGWVEVN